jgi:hypothetical protein
VLDLTLSGGIGVLVKTKNVGVIDALNVTTMLSVTGGILGLINIQLYGNTTILPPSEIASLKAIPIGLGSITIVATARAENAVEVSKNATGLVLLFFVILQ